MNIIVTGSLGHIGRPLTQQLLQEGHKVTVVSHSESRRDEITQLGAQAAIGSLEDVAFLRTVFASADALFAMTPPNYTEVDLVGFYSRVARHYIEALEGSSVRRVVYLSSFGAHLDHGSGPILGAHFGERLLDEHRDRWSVTHIRAGSFDYNYYGQKASIQQHGVMGMNYGPTDYIPLVAPSDIARVVAKELTRSSVGPAPSHCHAVSQMVPAQEIATAYGQAIGKPDLKWVLLPDDQMEAILMHHMPPHYAKGLVELGVSLREGRLTELLPRGPVDMGFPPKSLEEFAQDFARIYAQSVDSQ